MTENDTKILTIEEIERATVTSIVVPGLSKELSASWALRVRRVSWFECHQFAVLPPLPADAKDWPTKEWDTREGEWLASLTPEVRVARAEARANMYPKLIVLAAIEPKLTLEQARGLGEDATAVGLEILRLSGLLSAEPEENSGDDAA